MPTHLLLHRWIHRWILTIRGQGVVDLRFEGVRHDFPRGGAPNEDNDPLLARPSVIREEILTPPPMEIESEIREMAPASI